ncbi:MAG: LamG-like jellyroll fold domain-containing protein, partial [Phocaeicola sp.]
THDGIGFLAESVNPFPNIALNRPVKVSSYIDEDYKPAYAVDDNNGTCWFPGDTNGDYWMEVDLGEEKNIRKIETDFRYGTLVYQYKIEASKDGKDWITFSDKTANLQSGSPMTDFGNMSARYLKITVTGEENFGFSGIWRFRVFEDAKCDLPQLLVSLTAEDLMAGEIVAWKNNRGMYGKGFSGNASVKVIDGKKVVVGTMLSDFIMANSTLAKGNPYTIAAEVYQNGTWKHMAFVNDGKKETTYIDGKEVKRSTLKPIIKAGERIEIGTGEKAIIKGDISSLRIYSRALFPAEIEYIRSEKPRKVRIAERGPKGAVLHVDAADIPLGTSVTQLKNKGFMQGSLKAEGVAPIVDMIHGTKALLFNGGEILVSDFVTPETLSANSSYTVSAWVFNPQIDKNEAILEWANLQKRDYRGSVENEMKLFGFGSEANNGVMTHVNYGDMGFAKESLPEAGKWHNITVTFDGLVERVYVNGVLNNSEMKISFSTRNCKLYLGNNSDRNQPFSGALASVKLYNTCLTLDEIKSEVNKKSEEPIVLNVTSSKLIPGTITTWENRAAWSGNFTSNKLGVNVGDVDGKIALVLNGKSTLSYPVNASELKDGLSMVIALNNPKIENGETLFSYKNTIGKTLISLSQTKKGGVLKIGDSEFTVNEMPVVSAWEQMTLAINKSTVKLYVGNKLVMSQDLDGFNLSDGEIILGGNGKKLYSGAVSDFTLYNKMLSDREVQAGYELWSNSKNLFTESVEYQISPIMVSSSMIRMSAKKPSVSTPVEYLFTKYENGKLIETSGWSLNNEYVLSNVTSGKKYQFSVRMKDFFGNITPESDKIEVNTDNI